MAHVLKNADGSIRAVFVHPQEGTEAMPDGHPALAQLAEQAALRERAAAELAAAREIFDRADDEEIELPASWRAYRKAVRGIALGKPAADMPKRPALPKALKG